VLVTADGPVRLDAQDMGTLLEEVWGDSDYEFGVDVPATALRKLTFCLLREKGSPVDPPYEHLGKARIVCRLALA
jgi:hypothetical protein